MASESIAIITAFGELREWLTQLLAQRDSRSEKKRAAVESLLDAVRATQIYLHDLNTGAPEERSKEIELSTLWDRAARAFYGIDQDLAPLLQLKSETWAAPSKWSEAKVEQFGVTIARISEKARRLLAE